MNNINIDTPFYKKFNAIIGISFILLVSAVYITFIFNISIMPLNTNIDLNILENIITEKFIYYIKIFFSLIIPLSFFIFSFLFVLNPISVKSMLISFILIFLTAFYLYNISYDLLINVFEDINILIKLIINIVSANFIMLFIVGMSYIKYDIKKFTKLYDFYTMIAEIIIWSFLIFFIILVIVFSIAFLLNLNDKKIFKYLIRNDMKNLKIALSILAVFKISLIYFSYIMYNKMINTKLSISISRTISLIISALSIAVMIFSFKYNQYIKFFILFYLLFIMFFIFNMFLFRIDKKYNKTEYIIYIISNISGFLFSIFLLYICINRFFYHYFIIFDIIIIFNFLYNILITILKRYIKFIFLYNYVYIVLFIILLFY